MNDPIRELKTRAEILHKQKKPDGGAKLRLRDCLNIVAARVVFENWTQAKAVISGQSGVEDYGKLLYPFPSGGHINQLVTCLQAPIPPCGPSLHRESWLGSRGSGLGRDWLQLGSSK